MPERLQRYRTRTARGLAALALAATLPACHPPGPEHRLENYLERLGRSLGQPVPPPRPEAAPALPRLATPPATHAPRIGLVDFMRLRGCALQTVVAKNNSALGRQALPSQQLLNTIAFLQHVEDCSSRLRSEGETALADQLDEAESVKRQRLQRELWQAILGSDQARAFWRRPSHLADYPNSSGAELVVALEALSQLAASWLAGHYLANEGELEPLLRTLSTGDGGQLLAAMATLSAQLQRGDRMLATVAAGAPLCYFGRSNQRGDILMNVVRLYFAGDVQRWAAQLNHRYYQLWPALQRLERVLATGESERYRAWREQRDRALESFREAPRRHVEALHPLLSQCGLAPAAT